MDLITAVDSTLSCILIQVVLELNAFNTFIDDMFAFIITMPTSHRVACFRDDVVFIIYLYQRYLYPVDKSRINEFGESFEENGIKDSRMTAKSPAISKLSSAQCETND
ncbi:unnamed protein product [Thelazia callipaeda]|uniref:Lipid scramblase CLPTM1L n=1 Tax=Thelazia callipaeda TaxID=103827 RepID=A0A0N5CKF4_THECL|nr:unnamed protein product [Thelazia callipaeda]